MMKKFQPSAPAILFQPRGITAPIGKCASVLEVALKHKIPIDNSCGGSGSCGTCRVFVRRRLQDLPERNDVEQAMADDRGFAPEERLACQIDPLPGMVIEVPGGDEAADD